MQVSWKKDYNRYRNYFLDVYTKYRKKKDIMIFLEILLSLFTVSILAMFALKPTVITIIELVKEIRTKEELVEKMDLKIRNLSTAQSLYSRESRRIDLLNQSLPNQPNADTFQKQLSAVFARNSVTLSTTTWDQFNLLGNRVNTNTQNNTIDETATAITLTVTGQGDYSSVRNLMSDLEKLRRPVIIDTLVTTPETSEESQTILVNIGGKVLYIDPQKDIQNPVQTEETEL